MTTLAQSNNELGAVFGVIVLIYLVMMIVMIVAMVKVLHKAGYSGWWVLVTFVPIVNLVMYLVFAFADWPVLQRLRHAEQRGYQPYPPQGYPPQGYHPQQ